MDSPRIYDCIFFALNHSFETMLLLQKQRYLNGDGETS